MAERESEKQSFLSRLFGRKSKPESVPSKQDENEPVATHVEDAPEETAFDVEIPAGLEEMLVEEAIAPPEEISAQDASAATVIIEEELPAEEPEPDATAESPQTEIPGKKLSWWQRLTQGMRRTSSSIGERLTALFTKRRLDSTTIEDLEDILVQADLGVDMATRITGRLADGRFDKEIAPEEVKAILAEEVEKSLHAVAKPLVIDTSKKPFVLLMIGVNGSGKTTTIGKMTAKFKAQGLKVMLAAGDTFRAAAIEQLKVWGDRSGVPVLAANQGADAAGLAYEALEQARHDGVDVLMVDTAGRLQNKTGLMAELEKIVRVMRKVDPEAPHATLLVLDATVGQNALSQVELFQKAAGVTGLIMTKLDGTARGGILVALADKFAVPVHFIGVGEGVDDLEPFEARDFARAIAGLEDE